MTDQGWCIALLLYVKSLESLTQLLLVMKLSRLVSYSAGLVVVADSLAW